MTNHSDRKDLVMSLRSNLSRLGATLCAGVIVTTSAASPARAEAAAAAQTAFADTSKPVTFLKETVVTGARYPRRYYESPQALSFLSRNQLRDMAPLVIGDALQQLPGVDNSKDSPWEQRVVLRGLSGQRVLVLMDGMPMNSARGNGPHPSLVASSMIDRVEVVRGPSSVAYGSDAIGGAVNLITREPVTGVMAGGNGMKGSAQVGGGSAEHNFGGQVDLRPSYGKLGAVVTGGWSNAGDFDAPSGAVAHSAFHDWNGMASARYDLSSRLTLRSGYQLYRGEDIGIPGLSFDSPGASQVFKFSYYDRDVAHVTLEEKYDNSWLATSSIRGYWQRERRNFFSTQTLDAPQFPGFGIPPRPGSTHVITDQDRFFDLSTFGGQLQMTSVKHGGYRWTAGLDLLSDRTSGDNVRRRTYHFNDVAAQDSAGATAVRVTQSVPDGQFDNYGAYFQNDWAMASKWTLSAGGRVTHYHYQTEDGASAPGFSFTGQTTDNTAGSGSLGLVFEPVPDLHLSANVANGYRQPNAQDLYFDGAASVGFVIGNPNLEPEKSMSYDFGARWGHGPLALSGSLFLSTYRDLIDAVQVVSVAEAQGQPTYQYTNISEARMWGGEAEGALTFRRDWLVRSSIAGTVGDITSAEAIQLLYGVANTETAPLAGVPPLKGATSLRWNEPRARAWIEAGTRWSWRTNRLPLPTPGVGQLTDFKKEWIVADVSLGMNTPSGQRLVAGVRNLGDLQYRQALGSLDEPGRSFFASLSTDF
jgi:hemoglobin/transferrin/lactoferrin receptor protein